jgi:hypothetical protein
MENLQQEIDTAFDELSRAVTTHTQTLVEKMKAKNLFDLTFQLGLSGGAYGGKNDNERLGVMRYDQPELFDRVNEAEIAEVEAKATLTLKKLKLHRLELLLGELKSMDNLE